VIPYIFIVFLLIACVFDFRYAILPNKLTVCGTIVGIVFHTWFNGWNGLYFALVGAVTGFFLIFILYLIGALGAGDVKLFAAIGAIMGVTFMLQTFVYAILCAGFIGLFLLLIQRQMRATGLKIAGWFISLLAYHRMETFVQMKQQKNMKFPFMYAVVPGVAAAWYYSLG
jgi:prepilin peptidase CpaA